eukprot:1390697-Rhodomonas_salina.1
MEEGTVPDALYVVRFGFVGVSSGGTEVLVAKRGDVIGENALVGLNEILRRKRSARAKTVLVPGPRGRGSWRRASEGKQHGLQNGWRCRLVGG